MSRKSEKWLLGKPTSVLKAEFELLLCSGNDEEMMKTLPFAGPCKLPTKESVLKLYYSLRSLDRFSRRSDVPDIVAKLTKQYWIMAKIPAVDDRTVASRLSMLVKQYDQIYLANLYYIESLLCHINFFDILLHSLLTL